MLMAARQAGRAAGFIYVQSSAKYGELNWTCRMVEHVYREPPVSVRAADEIHQRESTPAVFARCYA
jgi:hypothetical protein